MEPLPADDRAPSRTRRTVPRGVWWAVALAIVVLAIAALKATSSDPSATAPPATLGGDGTPTNPLIDAVGNHGELTGQPMPDAELVGFDGNPTSVAAYRGTPLVINLWASYCTPCRTEMPDLEAAHQEYGDRVAFLGVDTAESDQLGRPIAAKTGVTYDLAADPQGLVAASIRTQNLPATVLVRADGTIARIKYDGAIDPEELRRWIDEDLLVIDAPLAYAFGVGMVATINPCGFAMLPAYLSFFLGLEGAEEDTRASVLQALAIGGTVTAGFLVVFGLLGILLDGALSSVQEYLPWVTIVLGIVLVLLGIALLRGRSFSVRLPTVGRAGSGRQLTSVFLFGVSYALVSLSCTIPLFIAAVAPSFTNANFASGVAAFLAYGLGMGVVLIALTVALALARHSLVRNLRKVLPYVYKISGVLLLVAGAYVAYYGWYELRVRDGDVSGGGAAEVVFDWNASISGWIQRTGPVRIGIVLGAAVGVAVALAMGRKRRSA